ncbi:MAG: phosphoribosylformylglycinamidine cyclo-ligase [Clostridiaceae bacterium]|nr:phosphoribosylformylglycinamidine cyclo-ligase [Clostridiaceae bacterium]
MGLTYKDSGVDKEAGYKQVKLIKDMLKSTYTSNVITDIGGFGGMFRSPQDEYEKPILVSGTDGVGTKLDLAFKADIHNTVGVDCVAMCVNDILCQGAKPLFFLDYIATGKLVPEKMAEVVSGVVDGCKQSGMALIGGETAEMPGIYQENHYDLAGFAVGMVDESKVITSDKVKVGDQLIGLKSSGVHSNGFSLVRKIIFDIQNKSLDEYIPELNQTLAENLLTPTQIYVQAVLPLIEKFDLHSISHITGGGIIENLPRALNEGQTAYWDLSNFEVPTIFKLLAKWGNIATREMFNTFNMGIGMILIVDKDDLEPIKEDLKARQIDCVHMGEVIAGEQEIELRQVEDCLKL